MNKLHTQFDFSPFNTKCFERRLVTLAREHQTPAMCNECFPLIRPLYGNPTPFPFK